MPKSAKPAAKGRGTRYWLFKSEPTVFSIHDLAAAPDQTTCWDSIRNYQARNFLRDEIQVGDRVFFYNSQVQPMAIVGSMDVVRAGYPDHTAWDKRSRYFDEKSTPDNPVWYMVDVKLRQIFPEPVTRDMLRSSPALSKMMVLQRGSRLSIQPVTAGEWTAVHDLAGVADRVSRRKG